MQASENKGRKIGTWEVAADDLSKAPRLSSPLLLRKYFISFWNSSMFLIVFSLRVEVHVVICCFNDVPIEGLRGELMK